MSEKDCEWSVLARILALSHEIFTIGLWQNILTRMRLYEHKMKHTKKCRE